jgi:NAD(P)-dependent dehydrogenase (short-subunit alcohol dehydrogenase family)
MDLELKDRVAIVTAGSKGIGLAVVRALLDEGARVVATSRSSGPDLGTFDGDVLHVPADLMDAGAPAGVVSRAVDAFGGVDILVNNAGGPPPGAKLPRSDSSISQMVIGATCSSSISSPLCAHAEQRSPACSNGEAARS